MKVDIVKVGKLKCNCYLLDIDGKVLIIDPGDESKKIIKVIGDREVVGIIITHHHFDHVGALDDIINKYNINVYDRYNMEEGFNKIDEFSFSVIYTPGHKEDCICIYFKEDKLMFCGDFIFKGCVGRVDLPGGDITDMIESINKIKMYNRDILMYPGHGEYTKLGYEIDNNVYFRDITLL